MISFKPTVSAAVLCLLSGCSAMQIADNNEIDKALDLGDYKGAALIAESRLGLQASKEGVLPEVTTAKGSVLHHMEAGEAWRMAGDVDRSLAHYDRAEEALQAVELQNMAGAAGKQVAATLVNDTLLDYKPSPAEAVLVNYNKAISFWSKGDVASARVEFNRAEDRIRRAVERYEAEIAKAAEEAKGKQGADEASQEKAKKLLPEIAEWTPYKDFVVPQATYLHGLFLALGPNPDDKALALELLERVSAIEPDNTVVLQDVSDLKDGTLCPSHDCVWIISDEGRGPVLEELRTDIPIVTSNGLILVSFAIPRLVSRQTTPTNYVEIQAQNGPVVPESIANVDRVIQSEYTKRLPGVMTRALVGATARAIAQNELNKQGTAAMLVGLVANAAMTGADVRSWRSLPGSTRIARVNRGMGSLTLSSGGWSKVVELPAGPQVIYIREPIAGGTPLVHVMSL